MGLDEFYRLHSLPRIEFVCSNAIPSVIKKMTNQQIIVPPDGVVSLRVFGSVARADADSFSDLDVLAVLDCPLTIELSDDIAQQVKQLFRIKPSLSFYGSNRIEEMFDSGHLFAWHIFRESFAITAKDHADFIEHLGKPVDYIGAEADIISLIDILESIPAALRVCAGNASYEGGLIFLCLRNIALSASWYTCSGLCFSRISPYVLEGAAGIPFPMIEADYDILMKARLCGQRGGTYEDVASDRVLFLCQQGLEWAGRVLEFAREVRNESSFQQASVSPANRPRATSLS